MKILQISNFYPPPLNGSERYVFELSKELAERGHDVQIQYTPLTYRNVELFDPPKNVKLLPVYGKFFFLKSLLEAKRFNPDIIHAHSLRVAVFASIIGKILNKPVVCSILLSEKLRKNFNRKFLLNFFNPLFKNIYYIGISQEILENIRSDISPANVTLIPCWTWNYEKIKHVNRKNIRKKFPKNSKIIFTVSRIEEEKGIIYLIKAAEEILKEEENCYFIIAGEGSRLEEYKKLVKKNGIDNNFRFIGSVYSDKLLEFYTGCDIIVIPSLMDCLFSLTESLVIGKPIVANSVRCVTEILENKKSGMITKPRDYKDLKNAILQLIRNKKLYKKLVNNSNIIAKKYSTDYCISSIEKLYSDILNQNKF